MSLLKDIWAKVTGPKSLPPTVVPEPPAVNVAPHAADTAELQAIEKQLAKLVSTYKSTTLSYGIAAVPIASHTLTVAGVELILKEKNKDENIALLGQPQELESLLRRAGSSQAPQLLGNLQVQLKEVQDIQRAPDELRSAVDVIAQTVDDITGKLSGILSDIDGLAEKPALTAFGDAEAESTKIRQEIIFQRIDLGLKASEKSGRMCTTIAQHRESIDALRETIAASAVGKIDVAATRKLLDKLAFQFGVGQRDPYAQATVSSTSVRQSPRSRVISRTNGNTP